MNHDLMLYEPQDHDLGTTTSHSGNHDIMLREPWHILSPGNYHKIL